MRTLVPLATVGVVLVSTPAVATDCLAYLAADGAYHESVQAAHADYKVLTQVAVDLRGDALAAAEQAYQNAIQAVPDGVRRSMNRQEHLDHIQSIKSTFQGPTRRAIDIASHDALEAAHAARREAMKGVHVADEDYSEKRNAVRAAEVQAIFVAQTERENALRVARARRDAAIAAAREAFEQTEAAYDAALKDAASDLTNAKSTAQKTYEEAIRPAQAVHDAAVGVAEKRRADAYVKAYANPLDGFRNIYGYDVSIVLKVAVHERKLCPDW